MSLSGCFHRLKPEDYPLRSEFGSIAGANVADCNHLDHVTSQGTYAGITGLVTILAYWLAGRCQTPVVLAIAMVVLFVSIALTMKLFGSYVIPQDS